MPKPNGSKGQMMTLRKHVVKDSNDRVTRKVTKPHVPREDEEQRRFVAWLRTTGLLFAAIPNQLVRGPKHAAIMHALGVEAGVPDILIFSSVPGHPHARGAAIEMKRRTGGVISIEQQFWLSALARRGWIAKIARGVDDAINITSTIYNLPLTK